MVLLVPHQYPATEAAAATTMSDIAVEFHFMTFSRG
jgi:hypothetical protein